MPCRGDTTTPKASGSRRCRARGLRGEHRRIHHRPPRTALLRQQPRPPARCPARQAPPVCLILRVAFNVPPPKAPTARLSHPTSRASVRPRLRDTLGRHGTGAAAISSSSRDGPRRATTASRTPIYAPWRRACQALRCKVDARRGRRLPATVGRSPKSQDSPSAQQRQGGAHTPDHPGHLRVLTLANTPALTRPPSLRLHLLRLPHLTYGQMRALPRPPPLVLQHQHTPRHARTRRARHQTHLPE